MHNTTDHFRYHVSLNKKKHYSSLKLISKTTLDIQINLSECGRQIGPYTLLLTFPVIKSCRQDEAKVDNFIFIFSSSFISTTRMNFNESNSLKTRFRFFLQVLTFFGIICASLVKPLLAPL